MWLSKLACAVSVIALLALLPLSSAAGTILTPSAISLVNNCPDGWTRFGSNCYIHVTDKMNWQRAQVTCQILGSNLVRIESEAENANLLTLLRRNGNPSAWIGMTDLAIQGRFMLIFSHLDAPYLNFRQGEPNNVGGNERCVQFWAQNPGQWNDNECRKEFTFICEI